MALNEVNQITIIGTGLLGGSVGLALRHRGYQGCLVGVGRRQETVEQAVHCGCIDLGTTDLAHACREADLILLATPVSTIAPLLTQLASIVTRQAIVTDVGSTKTTIVHHAQQHLPNPGRFVGSHPMAGSELQGPQAARPDLFEHRPVILTPTGQTLPAALAKVEELWTLLGMRLHRMSPEDHDRTVARISHLPHAAAVTLVELASRHGGLEVASTGFSDMTRIASGDPELWADIFLDNAPAVLDAFEHWEKILQQLRQHIADGQREPLLDLLRAAKACRDQWRISSPTPNRCSDSEQKQDESS